MKVEWHLYPEEKPNEVGWYMVTAISSENIKMVILARFVWDRFISNYPVVAWAELPRAYDGNEADGGREDDSQM